MKMLVLGAGGMLGHKIYLRLKNDFDVWAAARSGFAQYERFQIFDKHRFLGDVHLDDESRLSAVLNEHKPSVVINCVGVTTRKQDASTNVIRINSLLPHQLWDWAKAQGARVIHFSTDCVFSGDKGGYQENSVPNARDLYGLSKTLGELHVAPGLTIRSSIIGRELFHHTELVEWFIAQRGKQAKGFTNVFYSGVTTNYMATLVEKILKHPEPIYGLYHLASPRISKFELLQLINRELALDVKLDPDQGKQSDKCLIGDRLLQLLNNAEKPEWNRMIRELKNEDRQYREWNLGRAQGQSHIGNGRNGLDG